VNPSLRDRILRHLDTLPDERGYQVLDYIEFLESRYGEKAAATPASLLQRFSEGVEDTLRAGRVSTVAIGETMGLLNKAVGVLSGVAAAGKSGASDIASAAARGAGTPPAPSVPPAQSAQSAQSTASDSEPDPAAPSGTAG
jgi:hypothetical protein